MKKILLITNIPNPYRIPLFEVLNKLFNENKIKLKVIFSASTYKRRLFTLDESTIKFDYTILNSDAITQGNDPEKTLFVYEGLWNELKKEKPDLVIVSGFSTASMKVLLWKLLKGTPYIIWTGSVENKLRNESILRKMQRSILMKFASSFVVYGSKAKEYLVNRGINPSKIDIAINTVDTDFFASETKRIKQLISRPSVTVFTYVGYLVPRKNVMQLLKAIHMLSQKRKDFKLEIIGEGSSKQVLEKYVTDNNLIGLVSFEGFRQKEDLPSYYAKSNGFLFQTDFDIWGLVLNEAMASGIPCLSSVNAGAGFDLIQDGITGYMIDFNDIRTVTEKLNQFIDNKGEMEKMGQRAAEFIRINANLEISARGFLHAVEKVNIPTNKVSV